MNVKNLKALDEFEGFEFEFGHDQRCIEFESVG